MSTTLCLLTPTIRCLAVACEMLKALDVKKLSPTLQTLVDTLVCFIHNLRKILLMVLWTRTTVKHSYMYMCVDVCSYIIITIVRSYTGKYHEFVAVCIVTSAQHE